MKSIKRRGSVIVYALAGIITIGSMAALAVDWGRVQVTKVELQSAADAAARYGASGLSNTLQSSSAASSNAAAVAVQNKANGKPIIFDKNQDVEIGIWVAATRTFTPTSDLTLANAVKVTMRCVKSRGSAVPMSFLSILGKRSADVSATSIAAISYDDSIGGAGNGRYEYFLPATSSPWLAGMPPGTIASVNNPHQNPDYAGTEFLDSGLTKNLLTGTGFSSGGSVNAGSANSNYSQWGDYSVKKASPIQAGGVTVSGGRTITFDGVNGNATNSANGLIVNADGNTGDIVSNTAGSENGIANVTAPMNSVIGVFLDDTQPDSSAAPEPLNFSSAASRDFNTLTPMLKQPFYIGDGRTSTGEVQQFVPPAGTKRLYICTMDAFEWSNNKGGFYVTAHAIGRVVTVK